MATTVPSMSIFGDSPFSGVQWTGDETQHLLLASHGTRISLYKTNYIPPSSSSSSRKSSSSQVASVTLPGTASAIGLRMLSPNSSSASAVARADGSLNFISCSDSLSLAIHSTLQHVFRRSLQETCTGVDAVQDGSLLAIVGDHGSLAFVDCNSSNSAAVVEHVVERVSGMALTDVCWKGFSQIACTSFSGHVLIVVST